MHVIGVRTAFRAAGVAIIAAITLTFTTLAAAPAEATAHGCKSWGAMGPIKGVPIYRGNMCFKIFGSGLRLSSMKYNWTTYGPTCNWWFDVDAYDSGGARYYHQQGQLQENCKVSAGGNRRIDVTGKTGRVCGTLYSNAIRLTSVCHSVHR